jgi:hypothetical protein
MLFNTAHTGPLEVFVINYEFLLIMRFDDINIHKDINRIQSRNTRDWLVRDYKNVNRYSKLFSDGKRGETKDAVEKTKNFRSELRDRLSIISSTPRSQKIVSREFRS